MQAELEGGDFVVQGGVDCYGEERGGASCARRGVGEEGVDIVDFVVVGGGEELLDE
jgi:hypothetical protein